MDLVGLYRDALACSYGSTATATHPDMAEQVERMAKAVPPEALLKSIEAILECRVVGCQRKTQICDLCDGRDARRRAALVHRFFRAREARRLATLPHVFTSCQTPLLLRERS